MAEILVIDDEENLSYAIQLALQRAGHQCRVADNGAAGIAECLRRTPDLVLVDVNLPDINGLDLINRFREEGICVGCVVITSYGTIETAVAAMKRGAVDFLQKPLSMDEVTLVVARALEHQRVLDNLAYFRSRDREGSGVASILGDSPRMREIKGIITRLVRTPAFRNELPPSVLITGETGTGKDLVARAIHYDGPRGDRPFVHVNCTAVPGELFEAELFGHVKGAFTGADSNKKGLMEVANGGTIFLDEIGHLDPVLQGKLLTTIEHQKVRPVGGTSERAINVHVIAATNRDLEAAVEAGDFRADLFHRLRVVPIAMPALRDRVEDIETLVSHFIELYSQRFGVNVKSIRPEAIDLMRKYDWPGNVRELSHTIEHAVLMCEGDAIGPEHLQIQVLDGVSRLEVVLPNRPPIAVNFFDDHPTLDEIQHIVIEAALEYCGQNVSRTARVLGITREAVRYRLEKFRRHVTAEED